MSTSTKTIKFIEWKAPSFFPLYQIFIEDELWYSGEKPPGWFFWVGMMQQYGGQVVEVEHEVIE